MKKINFKNTRCVSGKISKKSKFPFKFYNFDRGHKYEDSAIKHFESVSGCTTSRCGFFVHPIDSVYGASLDAICPGTILLEVKTHAEKSSAPFQFIKGEHLLQAQLQMACAGFQYVIVESFHAKTNSAKFFLIRKDELLLSVIKEVTDSILKQKPSLS